MFIGTLLVTNWSEGPAHPAVFIAIDERIVSDDLGALEVKLETHLTGAQRKHGLTDVLLARPLAEQKKESSSSRSRDLASHGSVPKCGFIHLVDVPIGDF